MSWYCGTCCALDACDPAMNFDLLMLFSVYNIDTVITQVGYEVYKQVAPYMSSLVIIEEHLHRCSVVLLKEEL